MEFVMEHPFLSAVAGAWCLAAAWILGELVWAAVTYKRVMRDLFWAQEKREEKE